MGIPYCIVSVEDARLCIEALDLLIRSSKTQDVTVKAKKLRQDLADDVAHLEKRFRLT